jgi:hypothetical protein
VTAAERLVAAFARGLMEAALSYEQPDCPPAPLTPAREKTPEESAEIGRPRIPDIDHAPEEIDLFAAMKAAAREGDADLSDVAMVEQALREAAAARERDAMQPPVEGTRRVRAPDV